MYRNEKNILITGAAGTVGQYIALELFKRGYNILGTYRNSEPKDAKYKTIDIDLSKKELEESDIDVIVHIAARIEGNCEQLIQDNLCSTQKLIKYAEKFNVKKFIYISTISTYGESYKILEENSEVKNPSIYGMTKLICEKLLEESKIKDKMIISLPRMLGPHVTLNNIQNSGFLQMVKKIINNEDVYCYIPNVKYNNYMHVSDLLEFLEICIDKEMSYCKVLLGARDIYTMYDILKIMKNSVHSKSKLIKYEKNEMPSCSLISIQKALDIGYNPQKSKDILEIFMNEMKNQN